MVEQITLRISTGAVVGELVIRQNAGGAEFLANFVDLGRPPIVGLVEPEWELRRLTYVGR